MFHFLFWWKGIQLGPATWIVAYLGFASASASLLLMVHLKSRISNPFFCVSQDLLSRCHLDDLNHPSFTLDRNVGLPRIRGTLILCCASGMVGMDSLVIGGIRNMESRSMDGSGRYSERSRLRTNLTGYIMDLLGS